MLGSTRPFGTLLRDWRTRRRVSQLALACEAQISTKHLSFLETGRSQPSREMILKLAEELEVPLRERNALLVAAGFAPVYPQRSLEDDALAGARAAILAVVKAHMPHPALAVDRHWNMVAANDAVMPLLVGVDASLLAPANVLRLSLHPRGLAPRIVNLRAWRDHLLHRLRRQIEATADRELSALLEELSAYPVPEARSDGPELARGFIDVAVPLELETKDGVLKLLSTTTVFGTPTDVTLSEIAIEAFFPADPATARALSSTAVH